MPGHLPLDRRPGLAELRRLEHIAALLAAIGHDTSRVTLVLFSATGFTDDLRTQAARSGRHILLVGLEQLYG